MLIKADSYLEAYARFLIPTLELAIQYNPSIFQCRQKSTTSSIYLHKCMYVTPNIQVHVYIINTVLVHHSCRPSDSNYLGSYFANTYQHIELLFCKNFM